MPPKRKLSNNQVHRIRLLWAAGAYSQTELAERYGVRPRVIGDLVSGKNYKDAPGPITPVRANTILTDAHVVEVRTRYAAGGVLQKELAEEYGVDTATLSAIVRGTERKSVAGPRARAQLVTLTADDARAIRELCKATGESIRKTWRDSEWAERTSYDAFADAARGRTFTDAGGPIARPFRVGRSIPIKMVREARRLAHAGLPARAALNGQPWSNKTLKQAVTGRGQYAVITDPPPYLERLKPWRKK